MPDAMFFLNGGYRISTCNRTAARCLVICYDEDELIGREIGFVWQAVRTTERTLGLSRLGARRNSDDKERRDASDVFDDCQRGRRERHLNKCDGQDGSTRNLAELRRMVITLYGIVYPLTNMTASSRTRSLPSSGGSNSIFATTHSSKIL